MKESLPSDTMLDKVLLMAGISNTIPTMQQLSRNEKVIKTSSAFCRYGNHTKTNSSLQKDQAYRTAVIVYPSKKLALKRQYIQIYLFPVYTIEKMTGRYISSSLQATRKRIQTTLLPHSSRIGKSTPPCRYWKNGSTDSGRKLVSYADLEGEADEDKQNKPPTFPSVPRAYSFTPFPASKQSSRSPASRSPSPTSSSRSRYHSLQNARDNTVQSLFQRSVNIVKKTVAVCLTSIHKTQTLMWAKSFLDAGKTVGLNSYPHPFKNKENLPLKFSNSWDGDSEHGEDTKYFIFPMMGRDEFYASEEQEPGRVRVVFTRQGDYAGVIEHLDDGTNGFRLVCKHL